MTAADLFLEDSDAKRYPIGSATFYLDKNWIVRTDHMPRWTNNTGRAVELVAVIGVSGDLEHRWPISALKIDKRGDVHVRGGLTIDLLGSKETLESLRAKMLRDEMPVDEFLRAADALDR